MSKYLSEIIQLDELSKWTNDELIIINAGTGSGKSRFILNQLLEYTRTRGERILLLVPRTNIANQFESYLTMEDTHIVIKTYQWLENAIEKDGDIPMSFDYVIADESHYFFVESTFNQKTNLSFEWLLNYHRAVKILMSATNEYIMTYLTEHVNIKHKVYHIPKNYDYIDSVNFYNTSKDNPTGYIENQLYELSKTDSKAIIFINNLKEASNLMLRFKERSMLVFSPSKSNKEYHHLMCPLDKEVLLTEERMPKQFLFTTSALDTGVTIVDEKLKHIFVDGFFPEAIIQMIGRKRVRSIEDTVTIHMKNYNGRMIHGIKINLMKKLNYLEEYKRLSTRDFLHRYPQGKDGKTIIHGLYVYWDDEKNEMTYKINELYYILLKNQVNYCENLMSKIYVHYEDKKYNFGCLISTYFNIEKKRVTFVDSDDKRSSLIKFLKSFKGKKIYDKNTQKLIYERIDYRFDGHLKRSPAQLNIGLSANNVPFSVTSIKDRKKYVEENGIIDTALFNPNFNKVYWLITENIGV